MPPLNERQPLINYLKVQKRTDGEMLRLLRKMDADVNAQLRDLVRKEGVGALVRRSQLQGVQREIRGTLADFYEQTGRVVQAGRLRASEAAVDTMFEYGDVLLRSGLSPAQVQIMRRSAEQTAKVGLSHATSRYTTSKLPLSEQVYKTRALTNGLLDRRIQSAIGRGLSAREFAKDVKDLVNPATRGGVRYASMRLARSELNNAFHATTISAAQDQEWVEGVKWNLSSSHPKPDECDEYAAMDPFDPKEVPRKPHPHCFPAGTMVSVDSVRAVTKRWHTDGLIDVFIGEDTPQLSGTPNHPALTRRGWVALSELRDGDYVAVDVRTDPLAGPMPNQHNVIARIEDVADTLRMTGSVTTTTVPSSAEQFHGDGAVHGEVDIVYATSLLGYDWEHDEALGDLFGVGLMGGYLPTDSGLLLPLDAAGTPAHSVMGGLGHSGGIFEPDSFSARTHLEADSLEHLPDLGGSAADDASGLTEALTGAIEFRRVTRIIHRPRWEGHVYNLQAENGWYSANNIIVHNCLCYMTFEIMDNDTFVRLARAGRFD